MERASGLLREWTGKIKETFKDVVGELDPAEKRLSDLVDSATAHAVPPGGDLVLNLAVVDEVNAAPDIAIEPVTRAIRRGFLRASPHEQLLSLTLLEMAVKNSVPAFYQHLVTSELFADMLRVADPMKRWDPEVRDRTLCLIEDFGRGLPLPAFREAYNGLVDRGVDFPVRQLPDSDSSTPYYTAPALPPRAYGAPAVMAPGAVRGGAPAPAPAAVLPPDVSVEDAEAIRAAMAEMAQEDAARLLAEAQAAAVANGAVIGGVGGAATAAAGAAAAAAPPGGAPVPGVPAVPRSPRAVDAAVKVAANSAELLGEMLAPIQAAAAAGGDVSGVGEAFITDLADQCYRHRSVLTEVIPGCEDEALLVEALGANDELSKVLAAFEELTARNAPAAARAASRSGSGSGRLTGPPPAPSTGAAGVRLGSGGGSASAAGGSAGGAPFAAAFSLLDEGDEEDAEELVTTRTQRAGAPAPVAAPAAGTVPAPASAAPAAAATPPPAALIDLDDVDVSLGAGPAQAAGVLAMPPAVAAGAASAASAAAAPVTDSGAPAALDAAQEGVASLGLAGAGAGKGLAL